MHAVSPPRMHATETRSAVPSAKAARAELIAEHATMVATHRRDARPASHGGHGVADPRQRLRRALHPWLRAPTRHGSERAPIGQVRRRVTRPAGEPNPQLGSRCVFTRQRGDRPMWTRRKRIPSMTRPGARCAFTLHGGERAPIRQVRRQVTRPGGEPKPQLGSRCVFTRRGGEPRAQGGSETPGSRARALAQGTERTPMEQARRRSPAQVVNRRVRSRRPITLGISAPDDGRYASVSVPQSQGRSA